MVSLSLSQQPVAGSSATARYHGMVFGHVCVGVRPRVRHADITLMPNATIEEPMLTVHGRGRGLLALSSSRLLQMEQMVIRQRNCQPPMKHMMQIVQQKCVPMLISALETLAMCAIHRQPDAQQVA